LSSRGGDAAAPCVRARGLGHVFGDGTVALENIDLDIEHGSFVALLGPSGCGKSTLLRLISGLESVSRGTLNVESGRSTPIHAPSPIGFVFQDAHLLPWRTVSGNVALPLELAGVAPELAARRTEACIADVELGDAVRRFPDELSGGMRMRVSIARALVTEPSLLLLDEPFAALDELTRQRLDERLRGLWLRRRMTVLFVTHSLTEAVFLAERAIVMSRRPGRVVLDRLIGLPERRDGAIRTDVSFARETALLYQALEAHGSPEDARC
jgi:NitT/TauT family transport system ATP-binding protein